MKYLIPLIALMLFIMTVTRTSTPDTKHSKLQNGDTVLALGDSLTYGYGAATEQSYPARLQSMLPDLHILNRGINGETSQEGLFRLEKMLRTYRPKLTILCYGGNDILQNRSMQGLKENLKKMIVTVRSNGSDVLLISVPNFTLFGLEPLPLYEEVSKETQTPLLRGTLSKILEEPSLKSDQIHPNAKGYKKMAKAIYRKLKEEGWIEVP